MNQIPHISLSEDLRHLHSLLVTTFSDAGHSSAVISFYSEDIAEAVYSDMMRVGGHSVVRLYKKKEPTNESQLS